MDWIVENWPGIVAVAGAIVMTARAVVLLATLAAKLTASEKDDAWAAGARSGVERFVRVLKVIGLHVEDKK